MKPKMGAERWTPQSKRLSLFSAVKHLEASARVLVFLEGYAPAKLRTLSMFSIPEGDSRRVTAAWSTLSDGRVLGSQVRILVSLYYLHNIVSVFMSSFELIDTAN